MISSFFHNYERALSALRRVRDQCHMTVHNDRGISEGTKMVITDISNSAECTLIDLESKPLPSGFFRVGRTLGTTLYYKGEEQPRAIFSGDGAKNLAELTARLLNESMFIRRK